jgi:hypothetical protein
MSYPGASPRLEHPGLPCECILYRAMRKATWIDEDTGLVKPALAERLAGLLAIQARVVWQP